MAASFRFHATIENWAEGMDYCAIPVPAHVTASLGTKKAVLVTASIDGCEPFVVSLFPVGGGQHYMRLRVAVRKKANLREADRVEVAFTVFDRSKLEIPADVATALRTAKAFDRFHALTPGKKQYAIRKINEASRPATRQRRIDDAIALALRSSTNECDR